MEENKFMIPEEMLEAANGGTGYTTCDVSTAEILEKKLCPCCGQPLTLAAKSTAQESGTGNWYEFYGCTHCNKVYQKIIRVNNTYLWREFEL